MEGTGNGSHRLKKKKKIGVEHQKREMLWCGHCSKRKKGSDDNERDGKRVR